MDTENARYIAIEGCVGVGKSTLAEKLATFRQSALVLEAFKDNPFLEDFYTNPSKFALETSLQFLLLHCHQLQSVTKGGFTESITDFTFLKDKIFSGITFQDLAQKEIFDRACDALHKKLPHPEIVIYIRGTNGLIYDRIAQRNRLMESKADAAYFARINDAYEQFFSSYEGALHIIEADRYDCLTSPDFVFDLSKTIDLKISRHLPSD